MAGLNDDAQWIVLMGFVISFSFFFLATILNQSVVVGQTTAESVLDFPKNDIRDVKSVIIESAEMDPADPPSVHNDITNISLSRKRCRGKLYPDINTKPNGQAHIPLYPLQQRGD